MNTKILSNKNIYDFWVKSQKEMNSRINSMEAIIADISRDEITNDYNKKLNIISNSIDKKKGVFFNKKSDLKNFFKNL